MSELQRRGPRFVRVLVFQQHGQWLAQGVDFDLAAQGPSDMHAISAFRRILRAHCQRDHELGLTALEGLPEAPAHYAQAWERIVKTSVRVIPADEGDVDDGASVPAFILEAIARSSVDFNAGQ